MGRTQTSQTSLQEREDALSQDVATLARLLDALPLDRDPAALSAAVDAVLLSRRRLSVFIKDWQATAAQKNAALSPRQRRAETRAFGAAQRRLRTWSRFDDIVAQQIQAEPQDLLQGMAEDTTDIDALDHMLARCLAALHKVANPIAETQSDAAQDDGLHRDIPLPMAAYARMISAAYRLCLAQRKSRNLRFLDVGSGGGTKVLAASTCFETCDGLEYEAATVDTGKVLLQLVAPHTCKLIHGNALTFSHYADYDVIYFYRPLITDDNMVALETQILNQARPGTIILAAGGLVTAKNGGAGTHKMATDVYVTGLSDDAATALRQNAERMGTMVPGHNRRRPPNLGYWQILRDVSARNGYHD